MRKFIMAIVLAGLLGACSPSVNPEVPLKMQRVGILSNMGKMHIIHQGTTIFSNEDHDVDVSDWGLDAYVQAKVAAAIHAHYPSAEIVSIPLPESAFLPGSHGFTDSAQMNPLIEKAKVDTTVWIVPTSHNNVAQYTSGFGMFNHTMLGMSRTEAYAIFRISASPVGGQRNGRQACSNASFNNACLQAAPSPFEWHEGPFTAAEMQMLKEAVKAQIDKGLDYALGEMEWK